MIAMTVPVAAAASSAFAPVAAFMFNCDLRMPTGGSFNLHGTHTKGAFQTNIDDLVKSPENLVFEGGHEISIENHRFTYRWRANDIGVDMVEYANQNAAVITIERRHSDGRHVVYTLIGSGICETRRGSSSVEDGQ